MPSTTTPDNSITPKRPRMRGWVRVLRTLVLLYAVWCAVLYFKQGSMLFLPHLAPSPAPEASIPAGVEQLWITTRQGDRVEAWLHLPTGVPQTSEHAPKVPLVVFFHGNAETIDDSFVLAEPYLDRGFAVLCPEYRGYGRSAGRPSQDGIVADAEQFLAPILERPEIDESRVIYHGRSLGGGVAAQLAAKRPPAALIFQSTFASITSIAAGYGVPSFLVKHPFRTDRVLAEFPGPVLLLHGRDDTVIPAVNSQRLHDILSRAAHGTAPRALRLLPGDHNDFPLDSGEYWAEIDRFLSAAGLRQGGPGSP